MGSVRFAVFKQCGPISSAQTDPSQNPLVFVSIVQLQYANPANPEEPIKSLSDPQKEMPMQINDYIPTTAISKNEITHPEGVRPTEPIHSDA